MVIQIHGEPKVVSARLQAKGEVERRRKEDVEPEYRKDGKAPRKGISSTEGKEKYRAEGSESLQSLRICQDEVRVNSGITEVSQ
jgi:hypothetical protein